MNINVSRKDIKRCQCGAYTVKIEDSEYSMREKTLRSLLTNPDEMLKIKETFANCNHCVNHWGIDLCGCGSGEPFGKCPEKTPQCLIPSQSIEDAYTSVKAGWLADPLNDIISTVREARNARNVMNAQIRTAVKSIDTSIDGVKVLSENPHCGIVRFSEISKRGRWDPEFYIGAYKWIELLSDVLCSDSPEKAIRIITMWRDGASRSDLFGVVPAAYKHLGSPHPDITKRLCLRFGIPLN